MNNIHFLIEKIDEFIRKFYKNQLIRGSLYTISLLVGFFLLITLSENLLQFDIGFRTFIFYTFIISLLSVITYFIIIPLSKLYKLNTIISHEEAAKLIGKHFKNIDDKLLNTLNLNGQLSSISIEQKILLEASINQRILEMNPVPFSNAVDFYKNKKYIKFAALPIGILLLLLALRPRLITEPTKRLVNHNTYYEKLAPFSFTILNKELTAIQNHDFQLHLKVSGDLLPESAYLLANGNEYRLLKNGKNKFSYIFNNIQKDIIFRIDADGFQTKEYVLKALPNPIVLNFEVHLNFPNYTGMKEETISTTGDLTIPIGTIATWTFNTKNTEALAFAIGDCTINLKRVSAHQFVYKSKEILSTNYTVKSENSYFKNSDTIPYSIIIIPDQYPTIHIAESVDTFSIKTRYFKGEIKDDYGFTKLLFHYKKLNIGTNSFIDNATQISYNRFSTSDNFYFLWDLNSINIEPGEEVEYYFEIWDNDGIHGPKNSSSQKQIYKAPTKEELAEKSEKANAETKQDLQQAMKKAKDINKELADLNKKLLDKKVLTYEEIKRLNELTKKQNDLAKKVEEIKNENQKQNAEQNEFEKKDEALLEKQKQLQEMFDNIMTPELKEKMKELEKLLQQMDKEKVQEALEKMKFDNKELEKELDRTLEIFKQMEFEQKMNNTLDKLEKLSEKENKLSDKTNEKDSKNEDLKQEQSQAEKQFEEIKKDLKELEKQADELSTDEKKMFDEELQKNEKGIEEEMKNADEQLNQNQKSKAGKSQKNAAQKMKDMKNKMEAAMESSENEQEEEDIATLRDILDNLIHISFDQESLIQNISKTDVSNPQYVKLTQQQKKLKDDAKMIEDSLLALSKRQPKVSSIINKEIGKINANMEQTISSLAERQTNEASKRMQFVMTSENNLALMLSESLDQMQQQQSQSKPGSGKCSKPGGTGSSGKPKQSAAQMKKMQEKINQQIEKMKKQLEAEKQANKNGKKPGDKPGQKPWQKPGESQGGLFGNSKELSQLAAQQEALRRELQKMSDALNKDGKKGNGQLQKIAQEMEKTETDIVNKNITQETLKRQSEILTRLLEAEKAEQEREQEETRKSNEAKTQQFSNPNNFLEYKLLKQKEAELLKTVPPALTPFYKNKVNDYFNSIR